MKFVIAITGVCIVIGGGLIVVLSRRSAPKPPLSPVYVASGYGGFQKALTQGGSQRDGTQATLSPNSGRGGSVADAAAPVVEAYKKVEQAGERGIQSAPGPVAAKTKLVMAYAAARRKDLSLARDRFAEVKHDAAFTPPPNPLKGESGEAAATVEEEAAYQHAVCTAALGEKDEAEKEYVAFMKAYPESPLVHAAVKRVARFHGGNIPTEADSAWKQAMTVAQSRQKERAKQSAMCAPECLAELLKRRQIPTRPRTPNSEGTGESGYLPNAGRGGSISELAREMGTSDEGTSVNALIESAKRHGLPARGFSATQAGLKQLKLPAIAVVAPGHFVIIEHIGDTSVAVWNPDAGGPGKHARREIPLPDWQRQ